MRILKILGILFLIFALVVLGAWLYIKHEFPPEELSRRLAGFLSDQLGSPVEIGSADVRLFRGISLQDVRIFQPPPQEQQEWLRIKEIRLGYQWQALLHRRLAINNVTILQPKLTLAAEETPEKTKPREIAPPETTETALPLEIRVKRVEIVQAALDYRLPLANGTLRAQLSGLDLSLAGLLLTDLAPENLFRSGLRFGLDLHRARFSAEASFDRAVRLDTLQIAGLILRGIPTGRLRFRAERDSVAAADTLRAPLTLSVALKNAQLQAVALGDFALAPIPLPGVTFRLEGEARPRAPAWQGRLQARLGDFFLCELQTEGSGANRETLWHLAADTLGISLNRAFAALFAQK
ncbi:MAG TPA: AsmA family protein, partial [Bacteroidetes bacterium]|nr:AsmA family protein [Bacteroidota bacterium]